MIKPNLTMTQQTAQAAIIFEQRQTGHIPKAATLRPNEHVPVVGLYEDLAPPGKSLKGGGRRRAD